MPWKGEKDPYKIWLSEIILQQTRVEQGLKYYENFINACPTIHQLANSADQKIFKLWEGLGYYTRCRNLIASARYVSKELKGKFPHTYSDLKKLKGIGSYTAAAIASFAFDQPHAVVDGNVYRVLARIFGIHLDINSAKGKKIFADFAHDLLDKKQPGLYNQAIMDFGAIICKPVAPLCKSCPFQKYCYANSNKAVDKLPVKTKKVNMKKRQFYYIVPEYKNQILIRQRTEKDIWQQLFEFPLIETSLNKKTGDIFPDAEKKGLIKKNKYTVIEISPWYLQQLSHQVIKARFLIVRLHQKASINSGFKWVKKDQLSYYAFPKVIKSFINEGKLI